MLNSRKKILASRDKKEIYSNSYCPKFFFLTKRKTITPSCKLNGRSLNEIWIFICQLMIESIKFAYNISIAVFLKLKTFIMFTTLQLDRRCFCIILTRNTST
jgi:hypothetical protein